MNYRGWTVEMKPSETGRSVRLSVDGAWYGSLMRIPSQKTLMLYYFEGATDEHLTHGKAWMGAVVRGEASEFRWRRTRRDDGTWRFTTGIGMTLDTEDRFSTIVESLSDLRDLYSTIPELIST